MSQDAARTPAPPPRSAHSAFDGARVARTASNRQIPPRILLSSVALLALSAPLIAQSPTRSQPVALRNVRLADAPDAPSMTVIMRNGRIAAIDDAKQDPPPDVRVVDGHNFLVLPAFIDAYTYAGCTTPQPTVDRDLPPKTSADVLIDMREANRKGVQPSFCAASTFKLEKDTSKSYRAAGFGALASSPHGQLLSGSSALATTREAAPRDAFLHPLQFDIMGFECTGPGYPVTPMGAHAQLRQFFLDAQRQAEIAARRAAGKGGARLPFDEDFEAIQSALRGERPVVCEAETANDLERFIKLGDEFGFEIALAGGREAWKRAPLLKDRRIPVFLTLDWGDEPDDPHAKDKKDAKKEKPDAPKSDVAAKDDKKPDESGDKSDKPDKPEKSDKEKSKKPDPWSYEEPLRLREEKRRLWEETRDGAQRLVEAQVDFAFGSGKSSPRDLLDRARTLVEHGLAADVALAALTTKPAAMLGVERNLGRVEKGFDATLAVWTKNPLTSKDAKLGWLFVDGYLFAFDVEDNELVGKPDEGVDVTGTWVIEFDQPDAKPATAELKMDKDGRVKGPIRYRNPADDAEMTGDFDGQVAGKKMRVSGRVKIGEFEADVTIDAELAGDEMKGETRWKFSGGENARKFHASRTPKEESR